MKENVRDNKKDVNKNKVVFIILAIIVIAVILIVVFTNKNKGTNSEKKNNAKDATSASVDVNQLNEIIDQDEETARNAEELRMIDEQFLNDYNDIDERVSLLVEQNPDLLNNYPGVSQEEAKQKIKEEQIKELIERHNQERDEIKQKLREQVK